MSDVEYDKSCICNDEQFGEFNITRDKNKVNDSTILYQTVADYKGLEADIIIYIKDKAGSEIAPDIRNRIDYVAYTRARYYLYVIKM